MPSDEQITFMASLRAASRLRVPRPMRAQYKLEPTQIPKGKIPVTEGLGASETFLGKMRQDGYITVPPLIISLLKKDTPSLENQALEVTLEPA